MDAKLVVIGGGRMGAALCGGLLRSGWTYAEHLAVVESDAPRRDILAGELPGVRIAADLRDTPGAQGAVIAVKPGDVEAACRSLAPEGIPRVLSIAAGVSVAKLETWVGPGTAVLRAMPNTPAVIGAGVAALAGGSIAREEDLAWAEGVLGAVGAVVRVPEASLDAVTGLSGSGPAYVFLVAEALIEAGVLSGLSRDVSRALVVHTLAGSARLLLESGEDPEVLRAQVTSPGGTTAAGLRALEARGVRSAFLEAVMAATERSRQLGA
jgi:pyrroline-5-carboxylate reductase